MNLAATDWRILPHLHEPVAYLERALSQARLPQSLLLAGSQGLGKQWLAQALAEYLLCEAPSAALTACGRCRSCHLLAAGSHPDFLLLAPEAGDAFIAVDAVRAAGEFLQHRAQVADQRVLLLNPADAMQTHAANAFLKNLEEPRSGTRILLIGHDADRLLPTIRSRCVLLRIAPMAVPDLARWLAESRHIPATEAELLARLCFGRPGLALAYLEQEIPALRPAWIKQFISLPFQDPYAVLKCADAWAREARLPQLLAVLHTVVSDLLRLRLAGGIDIINTDFLEALRQLARKANVADLLDFEESWRTLYAAPARNLNLTLALQKNLLKWRDPQLWAIL